MAVVMAPFTPFFAEYLYQRLRKHLPAFSSANAPPDAIGKADSVHYVMLPTIDDTKMDDKIVVGMQLLQQTVELGRRAREAAGISMKTPVKEVVVVCSATNALSALQGDLEVYVLKELNAWGVSLTNDVDTWCSVSALPNLPVLANRLGERTRAATDVIKGLSPGVLRKYTKTNDIFIDIEGETINLVAGDLIVKSTFAGDEAQYTAITTPDGALTVAICTVQDDPLRRQGITRDLCNRVNKLRKKARLNISDEVDVFFADLNENELPPKKKNFISTIEALAHNKLLLDKANIVPMPLANCHWQIIISYQRNALWCKFSESRPCCTSFLSPQQGKDSTRIQGEIKAS